MEGTIIKNPSNFSIFIRSKTTSNQITVNLGGGTGVTINWGDGHITTGASGVVSHTYTAVGYFVIQFSAGVTTVNELTITGTANNVIFNVYNIYLLTILIFLTIQPTAPH